MLHRLSLLTLTLLALSLPFELETPLLAVGPLLLTNVELLLGVVLILAAISWRRQTPRRLPPLPKSWWALLATFVAALFISAVLAPAYRGNALKAALRTASGLALGSATLHLVRNRRDLYWVAGGLIGGGLLAAALGVAEIGRGADFIWLSLFRRTPTVAGPFLRLSGPFDYANQAAMYMEATLPLLLVLGWGAWRRGERFKTFLAAVTFLLYAEAAILTFSRASFATIILAHGIIALLLWRRRRREIDRAPLPFAATAVAVTILIVAHALLNPVFRLRFASESDNAWYQARFEAPAKLNLVAGEERPVVIRITNEGVFTWHSAGSTPINLAVRWVDQDKAQELQQRPRWPLPRPVAPGEKIIMEVPLRAPRQAGEYRLVWDLVQEHVIWFSAKTGRETSSMVTVASTEEGAMAITGETKTEREGAEEFEAAWQYAAPVPGRRTLWSAAWRQWRERPLLGIGLDNFRLRYGEVLGYESWNQSIHTNNWYIEMLVSLGLLGALPFLAWLGLLTVDIVRLPRRATDLWPAAIGAGLIAYIIHGLLDYFLLFNATALLFWLLVGLWGRVAYGKQVIDAGLE